MSSTLKNQAELIFAQEEQKDSLFRWAIVTGLIGQLARHLYHTNGKSIGTKADEEIKIAETILQLAIYAESRGLDLDNGLRIAFNRIYEKEWQK